MIIINYFQAGGSIRGSSHSSNMGWVSFEQKIDFNYIRSTLKEMINNSIEDGCPCIPELRVYYTVLKIEKDKIIGKRVGDFKSTKILKWKTK